MCLTKFLLLYLQNSSQDYTSCLLNPFNTSYHSSVDLMWMLTSFVCPYFRSGSLRSGFPIKIMCAFLLLLMYASVLPILYSLVFCTDDIRSTWTAQITLCIVIEPQTMKLCLKGRGGLIWSSTIFDTDRRWVESLTPRSLYPPGEGVSMGTCSGLCSLAKRNQTSLLSVGNRMALLQFCTLWGSQYADLAAECLLCNCHSTGTCDTSTVASICIPLPAVTLWNAAFFSSGCIYLFCMILAINGNN